MNLEMHSFAHGEQVTPLIRSLNTSMKNFGKRISESYITKNILRHKKIDKIWLFLLWGSFEPENTFILSSRPTNTINKVVKTSIQKFCKNNSGIQSPKIRLQAYKNRIKSRFSFLGAPLMLLMCLFAH